jgi:CreA protein
MERMMRFKPGNGGKRRWQFGIGLAVVAFIGMSGAAHAEDLDCVSTTFNLLSPNDKVCISDFDDPKVPGVTCYISQARKGGWGQPLGLNEDPSNFSVSCRQMGPITVDLSKLPEREEAFSEKTSIFFKATRIYRMPDLKRNTLIYLAVSSKLIDGSPANAISVVPIMNWPGKE